MIHENSAQEILLGGSEKQMEVTLARVAAAPRSDTAMHGQLSYREVIRK